MSAQFVRDDTHSKNGIHFSAASAKCRVLERTNESHDLTWTLLEQAIALQCDLLRAQVTAETDSVVFNSALVRIVSH